jgi:hypothetical protein
MLWIGKTRTINDQQINLPHPYRFCKLYISDKFKQILFTPFGKIENGMHAEVDSIIIDTWPCKFEDLQTNIEETLRRFSPKTVYVKGKWPSFDCSKAKSQRSFETDYVTFRLETDLTKNYGEHEVERIKVSAQPTILDNTYSLNGCGHLIDTKVAQIVLDIFEACLKIRS